MDNSALNWFFCSVEDDLLLIPKTTPLGHWTRCICISICLEELDVFARGICVSAVHGELIPISEAEWW